MSQFIESIKVEDQKIFNLDLHQKRVNATFANFGKEDVLDLQQIFTDLEHDEDGLYKMRIVYDLNGKFTTRLIPYAYSQIADITLVENNILDYTFKFEDRKIFDLMKNKSKSDEIIVVKNNHITDASYANLLFLKGKQWFTPTSYLLNGIKRQHLLKNKKIKDIDITLLNINEFSHFQIINAMIDFDEMIYPLDIINNLPNKAGELK